MDEAEKAHFARQLEELSRQSQQELYKMGSISADLTQARYLLDNIRNQMLDLQQAKAAVANEMMSLIGPPKTPPPLPTYGSDVGGFVSRVAGHVSQMGDAMRHPLDPFEDVNTEPINDWLHSRRNVAAE
jgi:hypothetical protein